MPRRTKAARANAAARPAPTKANAVIALLSRTKGATLDDLMKATGWQAHSVRGFISGTVKKKLGREIASDATSKGRVYRLAPEGR